MKFGELKQRFKNKYAIRVMAGILMVTVLGSSAGVWHVYAAKDEVSTEETAVEHVEDEEEENEDTFSKIFSVDQSQEDIGKDETVYMLADATGNVTQTIVSDWLKNSEGSQQLADASDLKDIENVKGNETFSREGDTLIWEAGGADIFYQGTTDKESPITETITYYLDGDEIAPEELAGQSGRVTIRFDYTNREKVTETVDGKQYEVYVPFAVVTGIVLEDNFANIEVTNGNVYSDGKNNIVVGVAMPGLKESLEVSEEDFEEEVSFPDCVEISADVTDFELGMTMTMASSNLLSQIGADGTLDLSEMSATIDEMSDASGQLVDGSGELSQGIGTLGDSLKEFSQGVTEAQSGVKAYTDGAEKVADGASSLNQGMKTLTEATPALTSGIDQLLTGARTAAAGAEQLDKGVTQLVDGIGSLKNTVSASITDIVSGAETIYATDEEATQAFSQALSAYTAAAASYLGTLNSLQAQGVTGFIVVDKASSVYRLDDATNAYLVQTAGVDFNGLSDAYRLQLSNISTVVANVGASGKAGALLQVQSGLGAFDDTGLTALKTGASTLNAGLGGENGIVAGVSSLGDAVNGNLVSGINELSAGAQSLADGAEALKENNGSLNEGMASVKSATDLLVNGVGQLEEGSRELADGMEEFDREAIQKMADTYHGDAEVLINRLQAWKQAGEEYQTFTQTAQGVKGSVKFVWETAAIKTEP